MAQDLINNDLHVNGALSSKTFSPPSGSITAAAIVAAAGVEATKCQQQYNVAYTQVSTATAAADSKVVHISNAAGTIVSFEAGLVTKMTAGGSDDFAVTFDLKVNGSSVLSAVITLNKTTYTTNLTLVAGTVTTPTYTDDDIIQVVVAVSGSVGTQGVGAYARLVLREDPQ